MPFPFGDRQAVEVRPQAPLEEGVAVDVQVMRGDRRRQVVRSGGNEVRRVGGGDVLEHHLQARMALEQGDELLLDEDRLAIKDVDGWIGDLAVDQQRHANPLHRLQDGLDVGEIAHPGIGVGGRAGGVELGGGEDPFAMAPLQFGGVDRLRQIGGHQRREARCGLRPLAGAQGGRDPIAVGLGLLHRRDRRLEVGHHDRPGELPCGVADHGLQHLPIAQVEMPVVRGADREGAAHAFVLHNALALLEGRLPRLVPGGAVGAAGDEVGREGQQQHRAGEDEQVGGVVDREDQH